MKLNKKTIILTLIVTLLPMIAGLILWNKLPDTIATHFDANNNPNGWSSKAFTVFAIPAIMAALQMILLFATRTDPRRNNIGIKGFRIVLWIIPVCAVIVGAVTYLNALNIKIKIGMIITIFVGILLILIGNYLPKNKTNYTFGVRTPWALNDEQNWAFTNRIGGYCYTIAGVLIILLSYPENFWLLLIIVFLASLIPFAASFIYYRKHNDELS